MKKVTLLEIYFLPPMAMARLGNSEIPLEAYSWEEDLRAHSACQTIIRPQVSFWVRPDGSLEAYLPQEIRFKDDGKIRPVAPFFELWAAVLVAVWDSHMLLPSSTFPHSMRLVTRSHRFCHAQAPVHHLLVFR